MNEWLVQFNNCSKDDIFIIAATNRKDKLDPAILRSGRFDRKILIPVPDKESRIALFNLELAKREKKLSDNINVEELALMTNDYSSSDITLIVNDAARIAYEKSSEITNTILVDVINSTSSSVTTNDINRYSENIEEPVRTSIGFQFKEKKDNKLNEIQDLELKKAKAIDNEDYVLANEIKNEINKLRKDE